MSMEYIRKYYSVPAKRGGRIKFDGLDCTIVGERNARLRVKFATGGMGYIHPTWHVQYEDEFKKEGP